MTESLQLTADTVHIWRLMLDAPDPSPGDERLLGPDERERAERSLRSLDRARLVVVHAAKRRILGKYLGTAPDALEFTRGEHGKPSLVDVETHDVHFSLSHSADVALIAVRRGGPVGVDVERWDERRPLLALARRFFAPSEQESLRSLAHDPRQLVAAFFATWSRKEAYVKATGEGIARGLRHFDVSVAPAEPARLIADRLDPDAPRRWTIVALDAGAEYSAAVAAETRLHQVLLLNASDAGWPPKP